MDSNAPIHTDAELPRSRFAADLARFPGIVLCGKQAFENAGGWAAEFQKRIGPNFDGKVIFEIGSFDAEFLCRIAARHPQAAFVGLDWKAKAIYDGAQRVEAMGLKNVVLIRGRGQEIRRIFAAGEVDEIWVFHPDPFAMPAERANRLISEPFLFDAHAVLRDRSSRLTLKTDHAEYFQWAMKLLAEPESAEQADRSTQSAMIYDRLEVVSRSMDFWNDSEIQKQLQARCFSQELTRFERRFVGKNAPIYFLEVAKR